MTLALMLRFYTHLQNDPARALFAARKDMFASGANPIRFANFSLSNRDIGSILMP